MDDEAEIRREVEEATADEGAADRANEQALERARKYLRAFILAKMRKKKGPKNDRPPAGT